MWEKESQATGLSRPSQVASGYGMPMGSAVVYPPPGYQPSFADVKAQQRASIMQATQRAHSYVAPVGGAGSDEPSDEQVTSQIKTILATANLMTVVGMSVIFFWSSLLSFAAPVTLTKTLTGHQEAGARRTVGLLWHGYDAAQGLYQ